MRAQTISFEFQLDVKKIAALVLGLHLFILFVHFPKNFITPNTVEEVQKIFKIKDIRSVGKKDSTYKDLPQIGSPLPLTKESKPSNQPQPKSLSLGDLGGLKSPPIQRPGQKPEVKPVISKKPSLSAINLKGKEIKTFMTPTDSASALSGDPRARLFEKSDILINLEVPEGVDQDELNKYELMFYSFQKRTAIKYITSFFRQLDHFQLENPHLNFPMTEQKQIMTGRLTYDEKGNIKQIKMIRWTNVDKLQDFFVDVLKEMDTLQNPPQALWKGTGEFSVFFSLVVNG